MADQQDIAELRPPQRRRRPPLSCTECRRRKLKCDRSLPCGQCVRSKTADGCVFVGPQPGPVTDSEHRMSPPVSRMRGSNDQVAGSGMLVFDSKLGPKSSYNRVTKRSRPDDQHELRELRHRLHVLENALGRPSALQTPETSVCDVFSEVGTARSNETAGIDDRVRYLPDVSFRGKKGKAHYCGRSHYATSMSFFQDVGTFLHHGRKTKGKCSEYTDMKQFKRGLRSQESQDHQHAFREQASKLDEMVPPRNVADQLLQLYLETFETTYRVLHVPTFVSEERPELTILKKYSDYWNNALPNDTTFVAQLLAVLAAGSSFYAPSGREDQETYQKPAVKWIMAVQSYISCTSVSPEINLRMIQTQCLLLVARLAVASDSDIAWASSGWLIRSAMTMGLHRDPTRFRKIRPFHREMRRRLWATIVELELKLALDGGFPPSIDLDECDCPPPSNWDDEKLTPDMENNPAPSSLASYTQNLYQVLLSKSLPLRHRIVKTINSLRFEFSYDEALGLGEELLRLVQNASSLFDDINLGISPGEVGRHRFAQSLYLFIMRKSLLALHRPFSLSVMRLPKFSYSRKICLEGSLEMLSQLALSPSEAAGTDGSPRLAQLGTSMFRDEIFHAAITICVELSLQADEANQTSSLEGPNSNGVLGLMIQSQQGVMLQAVERTVDAFASRIGAGGKGCKPYFFLSLVLASVKSRVKGGDPLPDMEATSMKVVRICQTMLNGTPWPEAQTVAERQVDKTPIPQNQITPVSDMPTELDPAVLLSTDMNDFTPMDLGGWFDSLDYGGPEVWDYDLFDSLPPIS